MEEISNYLATTAFVMYYVYILFGYGEIRTSLLKFALCKHRSYGSDTRFTGFLVVFLILPLISALLGYVLPIAFLLLVLVSPIILLYFLVTFFVDRKNKYC